MKVYASVDAYINAQLPSLQPKLKKLRAAIQEAAGGAEEKISYGMPAFSRQGVLVYFAVYEKHIGFYPTSSGVAAFKKQLTGYKTSKGAIQIPVNDEIPFALVKDIVKFRVRANEEKAMLKSKPSNKTSLFGNLSQPAQRALKNAGIISIKDLAKFSKKEILALHGLGPSSVPQLEAVLKAAKLGFKK